MTRILELAPTLADRFYQKGVGYEEVGALEKAIGAFQRAVQAQGSHLDARLALAYHCRRLDRYDEALAHCEAALAGKPCAAAYFTMGHILLGKQAYPAALAAFRRCLTLDPSFQRVRYHLALTYYLQGDYEVAITEFHRATQREADWESYFFLGECYRITRRPREAKRSFQRALTLAHCWVQVDLTKAQLGACERLIEFPDDHLLSVKDRAYCDHGIAYLGSGQDDGVDIPPYLFYHFDYEHLAMTLQRLLALQEAQGWAWEVILPVDIISLPLALALAELLDVGTEPIVGAPTLIVQALGETIEGMQDAREQVSEGQSFCLLLCWRDEWRPDVVGVATPLLGSLPWYHPPLIGSAGDAHARHDGWMDPRPPEAIARDIRRALHALGPHPSAAAQRRYYETHDQLRWKL